MNFDNMPELHSRYGYFATIAVMIVVALIMLFFFWWRGWLGNRRSVESHDE
jgi:magnesium transporter